MIEEIYRLIKEGELDWTDKLFRFKGSDPSKNLILHAGGLYNAYGKPNLTDEQKSEIKSARISPKDAWRENAMAKCNYIFRVVDNDNPGEGIQITTETTLLGDKVKGLIRDTKTAIGEEDGNPLRNPYCIRWQYLPNEPQFNDQYKAIRMEKIPLTDVIEELITSEPPDISNLIKHGNIKDLRTSMEAHYIGPKDLLDFDFIFSKAEQVQDEEDDKPFYEDDDAQEEKQQTKSTKNKTSKSRQTKKSKQEPEPEPEDDEDLVECNECGKAMREDEMVCPHCGFDYNEDDEEEPEPPPPPKRKRSTEKSNAKVKTKKSRTTVIKGSGTKDKNWEPPF